ncbi:NUDIX hydrolase [Aestuariivirga sp.]|uniref:NUDIX hydrolase n=1 Tax=Aestuariivirga sp. TaxID=2650926 RepID=UPI0025C6DCEE|nr:NUDIX hydrolase [Aestuariivirga sp.]MCA3556515.1 NUDIX hydrolase [Aestuariivirga sp.]
MLQQFAALPVRISADGAIEVYLVTSRGSGRWIIPKGNPIRGLAPHDVAAREAREEAGLVGPVLPRLLGSFDFQRARGVAGKTCLIDVYPMHVERQLKRFPEKRERTVRLFDLGTALAIVSSRPLAELIERYAMELNAQPLAVGT